MVLEFPKLEILQLVLTSGVLPPEIVMSPAQVARGEDGRLWVNIAQALPRSVLKELKTWGVQSRASVTLPEWSTASCWLEILPLTKESAPAQISDKTPVLFELADGLLPEVVHEILRLGNDRQSYCAVSDGEESTILLRVIGPPYYSLLRALDRAVDRDSNGVAPRAYVEQAPRVWVEVGHAHPLAEAIHPPPGKLLLINATHPWRQVDEVPLRDIYEAIDFQLPGTTGQLQSIEWDRRIQVPLRLTRGGSADVAELWVLQGEAIDQLDEFVQSSKDELLNRLTFAVGELDGHRSVVLRLRPSKLPPPVLVLDALACRSYLKLPNLFVPSGMRLHPTLRRDVVKNLLASDSNLITWLEPDGESSFRTRQLPDTAFRLLTDWVDYVLDQQQEVLQCWVQSTQFDFESFVCRDDARERPEKKANQPRPTKEKSSGSGRSQSADEQLQQLSFDAIDALAAKKRDKHKEAKKYLPREPSELQKHLQDLEQKFLKLESALDDPERVPLWMELAETHAALENTHDAANCWTHAFWEQTPPDADPIADWCRVELRGGPPEQRAAAEPSLAVLPQILGVPNPTSSQMQILASHVAWLAASGEQHAEVANLLGPLQYMLEKFEALLPVRTAWLAWFALYQLSQNDVLLLARARDRLLERLFQQGLSPDRDLPGFLRVAGLQSGDRFRVVRQQVVDLRPVIHAWSDANCRGVSARWTKWYIDMILAFGMARLGESGRCHEWLDGAAAELSNPKRDAVHKWFYSAYAHRVRQALNGEAIHSQLPPDLLQSLETMEKLDRYKVDRMRQHSRILEPHEQIDPYRRWHRRFSDELSRNLAELSDILDRDALAARLKSLLAERRDVPQQVRVVTTALEMCPRLGEAFAQEVLPRVVPLLDAAEDVIGQAALLEKSLLLAGHYDQRELTETFVERLHRLLDQQRGAELQTLESLESLVAQSLRGLRRFGFRDSILRLLEQMETLVGHRAKAAKKKKAKSGTRELWKLQLQIASGWFYFGQEQRGWPTLNQVRALLFADTEIPVEQTKLACAYIMALSQAPVQEAMPRLYELFEKLTGIRDNFTTNSHYSLSQLDVVEATVLAIVSEDFTPDKTARRWLDDDEFFIRRRVHRDVRRALEK